MLFSQEPLTPGSEAGINWVIIIIHRVVSDTYREASTFRQGNPSVNLSLLSPRVGRDRLVGGQYLAGDSLRAVPGGPVFGQYQAGHSLRAVPGDCGDDDGGSGDGGAVDGVLVMVHVVVV